MNPFLEMVEQAERQFPGSAFTVLLKTIGLVAAGQMEISVGRQYVRRHLDLEFGFLNQAAEEVSNHQKLDSYHKYCIMELFQAAAVRGCNLDNQLYFSLMLTHAAATTTQFDPFFAAICPAAESLEIKRRFLGWDKRDSQIQSTVLGGWHMTGLNARSPIHYVNRDDISTVSYWTELLMWNTDWEPDQGLINHSDATARMIIHLDCRLNDLKQSVHETIPHVISFYKEEILPLILGSVKDPSDDAYNLEARTMASIGDALLGVGSWEMASRVLHLVPLISHGPLRDTTSVHALIGEAHSYLRLGQLGLVEQTLSRIDLDKLNQTTDSFVTSSAERARYAAVENLYKRSLGHQSKQNDLKEISGLLRSVSSIHAPKPKNRKEYLRSLYFIMTLDEINSILNEGPNSPGSVLCKMG